MMKSTGKFLYRQRNADVVTTYNVGYINFRDNPHQVSLQLVVDDRRLGIEMSPEEADKMADSLKEFAEVARQYRREAGDDNEES